MIKVGIIGAGRIGRVHITSITTRVPDAVIKTVADPFLNDETAAWAKSMGVEHTTKDYKEIINDPEIAAVLICSSTDTHSPISVEAIKAGKVAAVLLAGGQGTRLGLDKPKGTLNVGINKDLFLFEQLINNLLDVVNQSGAYVPLYIMTSDKNNNDTVAFFEEHNFFGYDKDYVKFFIQSMAPSVDYNGKLYMESTDSLAMSPNGNGGWFTSLIDAGLDKDMESKGIELVNVFAVDNILQRIADPSFVGATILSGADCGSKVVRKCAPDEKVGVENQSQECYIWQKKILISVFQIALWLEMVKMILLPEMQLVAGAY